jgi:hypothetical protein
MEQAYNASFQISNLHFIIDTTLKPGLIGVPHVYGGGEVQFVIPV